MLVLAKPGGPGFQYQRGTVDMEWCSQDWYASRPGHIDLLEESSRVFVLTGKNFGGAVISGHRNAERLRTRDHIFDPLLSCPLSDYRVYLLTTPATFKEIGKRRVQGPLRASHQFNEATPLSIFKC